MSRVSRAEVALGVPPVVDDAPVVESAPPAPPAPKAKASAAKSTESEESS